MADFIPTDSVTSVTRTLKAAVAVTTSPFTGSQQVQDWGGSWWEYEIEFAVQYGAAGRKLSAFFAALRGPADVFIFADPFIVNPTGLGTPLVNGAGQTGNSLVTDGWGTVGMKAGDFFHLLQSGRKLYQLTADSMPVAGAMTLYFVPALRASPADNAALNVVNPGVVLRLTSPVPSIIGLADIYRFSITAREAI